MRPLPRKVSSSITLTSLFLAAAMIIGLHRVAVAEQVQLQIKIIYAHTKSKYVDPKIESLVKTKPFTQLKFTAYELIEEVPLKKLEIGSSTSVQLPNKRWMKVRATELTASGKLRLDFSVDKPEFSTTVVISPGATLAVGGPGFKDGVLILAVTRPRRP